LREAGDWRWVLVGDGPLRPRLEEQIERNGLRQRTIVAGGVSDPELHAWYAAADLFVHPTLYEGSSLVTLEAMGHRRPVVATRAGGLPDKVLPGITGWLVAPGDVEALRETLHDALSAAERWPELGAAGRRLAEQSFAWPAVTTRLLELYEALLERRRTVDLGTQSL
jgi:glycosyltransferase involved in cell wall biosynthesis